MSESVYWAHDKESDGITYVRSDYNLTCTRIKAAGEKVLLYAALRVRRR